MTIPDASGPTDVVDTLGARYRLGEQLGEGGQGAVYRVEGQPMVVKLVFSANDSARTRILKDIARVKRLPLDGLHVTRPLRALTGSHVGYVMELMEDLEPLTRLAHLPLELCGADYLPWYIETGGLERRLRRLAALADVFARLHGRGLSYGDASPSNVFMSSDLAHDEVWLIDPDNLCEGQSPRAVYTPSYAAPELLNGKCAGTHSLTDAWSLAVLTFETLSVLHPFRGDLVEYGDPDLEDQAARGELPWVDDPDNADNQTDRGLPRPLVLTRPLRQLAQRCFGDSRLDPLARPGVAQWAEALHQAADQTLMCPACGSSYYLNAQTCPWCDAQRPRFVLVNARVQQRREAAWSFLPTTDGRPQVQGRIAVQSGRATLLGGRHLRSDAAELPWLRLDLGPDGLRVRAVDSAPDDWCLVGGSRPRPLSLVDQLIPLHDLSTWSIEPHAERDVRRVLHFEVVEGAH